MFRYHLMNAIIKEKLYQVFNHGIKYIFPLLINDPN